MDVDIIWCIRISWDSESAKRKGADNATSTRRRMFVPAFFVFLSACLGGGVKIPFQDVSKCPLSGLLDLEQRQAAASRLNAAVLQSQQQEKGPWLPDLLRQLVYFQVRGVIMLRVYRLVGMVDLRE